MYCTTCETITEDLTHYKTQLHAINIKRKLAGYTPLTVEEFESDSRADEIVVDLHHEHAEPARSRAADAPRPRKIQRCMLCEEEESAAHYLEHGIGAEQIAYIQRRQCHVCYERFVTKELLLKHLASGSHRSSVTDGQSLYLMNGGVLHPSSRSMESTAITVESEVEDSQQRESNAEQEHYLDQRRLNDFKCSVHTSHSFRKKPH
ncbi:hypothetical protein PAPHI01_0171 [Pancytospora philotis]|nr:hypothetical protein PAPHI01_0171 [Pancytospora philotis]